MAEDVKCSLPARSKQAGTQHLPSPGKPPPTAVQPQPGERGLGLADDAFWWPQTPKLQWSSRRMLQGAKLVAAACQAAPARCSACAVAMGREGTNPDGGDARGRRAREGGLAWRREGARGGETSPSADCCHRPLEVLQRKEEQDISYKAVAGIICPWRSLSSSLSRPVPSPSLFLFVGGVLS